MPSAISATKRHRVLTFRASRRERELWDALAAAAGVSRSEWIREVLCREGRRLERERLVKRGEGLYGCVCEPGPANGDLCPVCGERRYWTQVRRWKARERMRRLREARRQGLSDELAAPVAREGGGRRERPPRPSRQTTGPQSVSETWESNDKPHTGSVVISLPDDPAELAMWRREADRVGLSLADWLLAIAQRELEARRQPQLIRRGDLPIYPRLIPPPEWPKRPVRLGLF